MPDPLNPCTGIETVTVTQTYPTTVTYTGTLAGVTTSGAIALQRKIQIYLECPGSFLTNEAGLQEPLSYELDFNTWTNTQTGQFSVYLHGFRLGTLFQHAVGKAMNLDPNGDLNTCNPIDILLANAYPHLLPAEIAAIYEKLKKDIETIWKLRLTPYPDGPTLAQHTSPAPPSLYEGCWETISALSMLLASAMASAQTGYLYPTHPIQMTFVSATLRQTLGIAPGPLMSLPFRCQRDTTILTTGITPFHPSDISRPELGDFRISVSEAAGYLTVTLSQNAINGLFRFLPGTTIGLRSHTHNSAFITVFQSSSPASSCDTTSESSGTKSPAATSQLPPTFGNQKLYDLALEFIRQSREAQATLQKLKQGKTSCENTKIRYEVPF